MCTCKALANTRLEQTAARTQPSTCPLLPLQTVLCDATVEMQKLEARRAAGEEVPDAEFIKAYRNLGSALNGVKNMSRKRHFTNLVTEAKALLDTVLPEVKIHTHFH